jgi:excisionase family DNA binding protein
VRVASAVQTLAHVVELRRVRQSVSDREAQRRLGRVIGELRQDVGVGVPKRRAAALLGVSVQALERWVASGALPGVRVPGSSRQLIDAEALLALAEEVADLREQGERRGVVAAALRRLEAAGRLPRKLRPNQSARELRHEYLHTTPAERLRQGIELSEFAVSLAARGRETRR